VRRHGLPDGRWHPYGFAVFKVGQIMDVGSLRLHIWSAGARVALRNHPPVHEHEWHLAGLVLAGTYVDESFEFGSADGGSDEVVAIHTRDATDLFTPTGQHGRVHSYGRSLFSAGEIHFVEAGAYHASPIGLGSFAATLALTSAPVQPRRSIVGDATSAAREYRRPAVDGSERARLRDELAAELSRELG
jgi:hypothetical protein